jgi:hypothetical protein
MQKVKIKLKTGLEVIQKTKNGVTQILVPEDPLPAFRWNLQKENLEKKNEIFIQDRIKELAGRESWRITNCLN